MSTICGARYLSASHFLTGEHRDDDPERGVFECVEVERSAAG